MANKKTEWTLNDIEKLEWEYHQKHRYYLIQEKHNVENKYSQHLVYLAAWIFTFIFSIDKIFDSKKLLYKILLNYSIGLSILTLIFILFSFLFSIRAFKERLDYWDEKKEDLPIDCNSKIMNFFIYSWTLSIIISIILLFIFYILNF